MQDERLCASPCTSLAAMQGNEVQETKRLGTDCEWGEQGGTGVLASMAIKSAELLWWVVWDLMGQQGGYVFGQMLVLIKMRK